MSHIGRFADGQTVFGCAMPPEILVRRIQRYSWQASFLRLAHLAAALAQDPAGPKSAKLRRWARAALRSLSGRSEVLIARARDWAASGDEAVVVHEEAIDFVQHLAVLHGQGGGDAPPDGELALWLLGAADSLGKWEHPDGRSLSANEEMIAEFARVARYNNNSIDAVPLIVRTRELFAGPPFAGALSNPALWNQVELAAFGCPFAEHFETRLLPYFTECIGWGQTEDRLPLIEPTRWVQNLPPDRARSIIQWMFSQSRSRDELVAVIRERMRPCNLLPHAPTALLRHPIVRLSNDLLGIASPWRVRNHLVTGIWAAFMQATKETLGVRAAQEWTIAFGYLFEEWMRIVARDATSTDRFRGELMLPTHPGSDDEIEDVVVVEGGTAVLFSGKARLMEESVARHARSRDAVMDWYDRFFFAPRGRGFRDGVVKQLSDRIDSARAGRFEPALPRAYRIIPVLVTYDLLCDEFPLYRWLAEECAKRALLQQPNVAPLVIVHIDDFERLMARAGRGVSVAGFFSARGTGVVTRVHVQLGATTIEDRLPRLLTRFEEICKASQSVLFPKV